MPYNGTGTFSPVYNWANDAAAGILVRSDRMDTQDDDIADGLSNCVTRDGQSAWTANLPAGGFKITGLANGASGQDSVTYAQVFASPTFTGTVTVSSLTATGTVTMSGATTVTVPTASAGDNTTKAASTAFVNTVAMAAALPAQATNAGKVVTTDGSSASWASLVSIPDSWVI